MLLCHPERVALEGDAPAAALGRGGVDAQEERRVRREAARQQAARVPRSDVHQQLVLGVREHLAGDEREGERLHDDKSSNTLGGLLLIRSHVLLDIGPSCCDKMQYVRQIPNWQANPLLALV